MNFPGAALEDLYSELTFEGLDPLGQCRLGQVQPARRTAEVTLPGHLQERPQLTELHIQMMAPLRFLNRPVNAFGLSSGNPIQLDGGRPRP